MATGVTIAELLGPEDGPHPLIDQDGLYFGPMVYTATVDQAGFNFNPVDLNEALAYFRGLFVEDIGLAMAVRQEPVNYTYNYELGRGGEVVVSVGGHRERFLVEDWGTTTLTYPTSIT